MNKDLAHGSLKLYLCRLAWSFTSMIDRATATAVCHDIDALLSRNFLMRLVFVIFSHHEGSAFL